MSVVAGLYAALGLPPGAPGDDVKKAFRTIARECHPDVAGPDPDKARRFQSARDAYEVLSDPEKLKAAQAAEAPFEVPRPHKGRTTHEQGAFFRAFHRRAGGGGAPPPPAAGPERTKSHGASFRARAEGMDGKGGLDDLFADFGFGGGAEGPRQRAPLGGSPRRGDDVIIDLEVPAQLARDGGTLSAHYAHLVRAPSWTPESRSPGIEPRREAVDLEILVGSRHGQIRRFRGLGDAGPYGGPPGDLVARLRILDEEPRPSATQTADARRGAAEPRSEGAAEERRVVDITVAEALLGGRIELGTPSGRVRIAIPPCTSSGRTFRLRGRGEAGADGQPRDVLVEVRIVTPVDLDPASRQLIEEFARLNAEVPER